MERSKSNAALAVGILVLGAAGLALMVWLSPQAPSAPPPAPPSHEAPAAAPNAADLPVPAASDPFRTQLVRPQATGTVPVAAQGASTTIKPGIDPFKEKLIQQSREATASPFGQPPASR